MTVRITWAQLQRISEIAENEGKPEDVYVHQQDGTEILSVRREGAVYPVKINAVGNEEEPVGYDIDDE